MFEVKQQFEVLIRSQKIFVSQNWKNKQKGVGGSAQKIKKSKMQNFDFLIRGRGVQSFFPNINEDFKCFS